LLLTEMWNKDLYICLWGRRCSRSFARRLNVE
jgi:hypothetical protein